MSGAWHNVFVGRSREIAALRAGLVGAADGRGRAVILVGEPGIGKTRTAAELAALARDRGFEVLCGRCFEGEGAPAFWPWVQVLRAYVAARDPPTLAAEFGTSATNVAAVFPELHMRLPNLPAPPLLEPGPARFRFFEGVATALSLAARTRPIVLTLDDLQGMDEPSLLLLAFLARTLRDTPILIVGGARSVAFAADHPLADTLGELVREQVMDLLPLGGLTEGEVEALLAHVTGEAPPPGLAGAVHGRTEGNPLYVTEVARMMVARGGLTRVSAETHVEIPDTVRLAIARNLRSLSTECRELLTLASLFGREFRLEALLHASGLERERALGLLDEAETARVVDPIPSDPDRRRFAHALFAEALPESLSSAARATLNRRVAESLADDPRAEEHAGEIAHHWLAAGLSRDPEQAIDWACRAAERARELLAHEEAARLYQMALAALDSSSSPNDTRRAELLLGLGKAHRQAGDAVQRKAAFLEAAAVARRLGSADLLTRAALGFVPPVVFGETAEPDPCVLRLLEEAIEAWGGRDSALHACALARLSGALFFGDRQRVSVLGERAEAMARRVGQPETLRFALAARLMSYHGRNDPAPRLAMATELATLAEVAADLETLAVARLWRTIHLLETGDAPAMRREQAALARLARALRRPVWSWYASVTEGMCALHDGRFDDAERAIAKALRIGQAALPYPARVYFVFTMLALRTLQGRAGEFASEFRSMCEEHPDPRTLSALAWVESERGDVAETRRIVERLTAEDFADVTHDTIWLIAVCCLVEGCAFLGDVPRAARLYDFLATNTTEWVVWADAVSLGPLEHYLGLLTRTLGRLDQAARHFEGALASSTRADSPPFLARSQYEYARLLLMRGAAGDPERARSLLTDARATAETIGMAGLRAKIDALGESPQAAADEKQSPQVFRFEAGFWTIASFGKEIRLHDMRGLHYLAQLLRAPGRELHASDLAGAVDAIPVTALPRDRALSVVAGLGDAGEILDARARASYRQRLAEVDEDLADAERHADLGRLGHARAEREALLGELSAAARGRRAASHAERSRVAVTKAIGAALERIAASHPELGAHFSATIRRGYFCAYVPDPRLRIEWEG